MKTQRELVRRVLQLGAEKVLSEGEHPNAPIYVLDDAMGMRAAAFSSAPQGAEPIAGIVMQTLSDDSAAICTSLVHALQAAELLMGLAASSVVERDVRTLIPDKLLNALLENADNLSDAIRASAVQSNET